MLRRDKFCQNARQRKAWSFNAGHESERITDRAYAKMTAKECNDAFAELAENHGETIEDKDLIIDLQLGKLVPGTAEHERARLLLRARMDRD